MLHLDPTVFTAYLVVVLAVAGVGVALSLSVVARGVLVNRRARLSRGESLTTYYGHLAFSH